MKLTGRFLVPFKCAIYSKVGEEIRQSSVQVIYVNSQQVSAVMPHPSDESRSQILCAGKIYELMHPTEYIAKKLSMTTDTDEDDQ